MRFATDPIPGWLGLAALALCAALLLPAVPALCQQPGRPQPAADTANMSPADPPHPEVPAGAGGAGGLLVGPTRVVFEGGIRTAQLTLVNTGARTATYRLKLVRLRMSENGIIRQVTDPDSSEQFADTLVRFSPRRVELEPQVPQTVRLQLRKPADLPAGEYRSHLLIQALPEQAAEQAAASGPGIHLNLQPVFGVSIPVIVRQGETSASLTLSDVSLQPGSGADQPPRLRVVLNRSGNRSVYGNLVATWSAEAGKEQVVGVAKGVAVYTPNARRVFELPLTLDRDHARSGRLDVKFDAPSGAHDGPHARAAIPLR
jgi:P pilus assembly chaperone PapD